MRERERKTEREREVEREGKKETIILFYPKFDTPAFTLNFINEEITHRSIFLKLFLKYKLKDMFLMKVIWFQ